MVQLRVVPLTSDRFKVTRSENLMMGQSHGRAVWPARVGTPSLAKNWELQLATVGPQASEELAHREGPDLLLRTERGRRAAEFYLGLISDISDLESYWNELRAKATVVQRKSMSKSVTFFLPSNSEHEWNYVRWAHETAGYTVIMNLEAGEAAGFFSAPPDIVKDYDWITCLQVMASTLYTRHYRPAGDCD